MSKSQSGIAGIILAAGESKRMGHANKLTADMGGEAMLRRIARAALMSRLDNPVIVLGHDAERVAATLHDIDARITVNRDYRKGQSTSIRMGVEALDEAAQAAMILLGDMPLVDTELINALIAHHLAAAIPQSTITLPVIAGKKNRYGNPVIWGAAYFPELKNLQGDKGGKALFEIYGDCINAMAIRNADVFMDADTKDALANLRKKIGGAD